MALRSLGWLGVRTPAADAMNAFYRDLLDLEVILERPGATWFRLQDGTEVHVYGSNDEDHEFFGTVHNQAARLYSREEAERWPLTLTCQLWTRFSTAR